MLAFAMFDNDKEQRREIWSYGYCRLILAREALTETPEYLAAKAEIGSWPPESLSPWVADRILGDIRHIPLYERPGYE